MMNQRIRKFIAAMVSVTLIGTTSGVPVYAAERAGSTVQEESGEARQEVSLAPLHDLPVAWDLTDLYADEAAFEKDMKRVEELIPSLKAMKGTLSSVEGILNYLENPDIQEITAISCKAEMYVDFLSSLDATDAWARKAGARYGEVMRNVQAAQAFEAEEIMSMPLEKRQEIFSDERLAPYAYYMKAYTDPDYVPLGEEGEMVKNLLSPATERLEGTFNIFSYVELPKPEITFPDGKKEVLTNQLLSQILQSPDYDHAFRKGAYSLRNTTRKPYINTYASLLEGQMQKYWAEAQMNGYDSTLEWAMDREDVDPAVYGRIIDHAHSLLPKAQEYYRKLKEIKGCEELMPCDLQQSVTDYEPPEISYEEAVNLGREGIAVWGKEYMEAFDQIITAPHIDVYPSDTKATGAFEFLLGNETTPFVLYNFDGTEPYTSTIVHEMGHAVYSQFSAENQPPRYSFPTIFTQEVASTANELMFHKAMIEKAGSKKEKLYWLEKELSLLFSTVLTQCLYSEFEDYCYKTIEAGGALNAEDLCAKFLELARLYYGDSCTVPDDMQYFWTLIPHFYSSYYVYKYATSITYASAICLQAEEKGQAEIDAYLDFLKAGASADPASLLKIANVDPMAEETYETAGKWFAELIDEFIAVADEMEEEKAPEEFPMDPSAMKPWINSNIMGMVTDEVTPDRKDDYYVNINHDWLRDKKPRDGHDNLWSLNEAEDLVRERCLDILNDRSLTGDDAELIQNYYDLQLDWDSRNARGITPAWPLIGKILGLESLKQVSSLIEDPENMAFLPSLLPVRLGLNADDSNLIEVCIDTAPLTLEDSAEYQELTKNGERIKKASEEGRRYMLSRFGLSEEEIADTIDKCLSFETKLAKYKRTALEEADPSSIKASINPVTMEDIREMSPAYPLADIMDKLGWSKSELINVEEPEFIKGLNALYTEENLPEIRSYLLAHAAGGLISCLDEEAYRKYQEIEQEMGGITGVRPDEEIAYEEAKELFPDSFARIYIDRYLNEEIRNEITGLCQDIVEAYDRILDTEDWLTEETRRKAKEKLAKLKIHAVYPDKWEDDSMYHVTSKADGGSYFEALKEIEEAQRKKGLSLINTRYDKEIWGGDILMTNASYDQGNNSINILPGILCDASYRSDMSLEEKLGALGAIIGHEISHAFDPSGAQYDGDGNLNDWWQPQDYKAFEERAEKLAAYYDKVIAFDDGTPYHGTLVEGEAIADMAGIKSLLMIAENVEGFDYDKFFRSYAGIFASTGTLEYNQRRALTNPHPLNYLRANVTMQQFDEFIETYGIKEGDGMYLAPEDRINVW